MPAYKLGPGCEVWVQRINPDVSFRNMFDMEIAQYGPIETNWVTATSLISSHGSPIDDYSGYIGIHCPSTDEFAMVSYQVSRTTTGWRDYWGTTPKLADLHKFLEDNPRYRGMLAKSFVVQSEYASKKGLSNRALRVAIVVPDDMLTGTIATYPNLVRLYSYAEWSVTACRICNSQVVGVETRTAYHALGSTAPPVPQGAVIVTSNQGEMKNGNPPPKVDAICDCKCPLTGKNYHYPDLEL